MKERKKTTLHLQEYTADVGTFLAFFHLCLVSVLFKSPSLLEMKFYRNFFHSRKGPDRLLCPNDVNSTDNNQP